MNLDLSPSKLKIKSNNYDTIFDTKNRWQSWLDVEAALAISQSKLGMIPKKVGKKIASKCKLSKLNIKNIEKDLKKKGHKLVPLVWELSRVCDNESKKYVHWGATTQNIVSNGDLLILKKFHKIILGEISDILSILSKLSIKTKDYVMAARTHGQHALPTTFGFKTACWIDEISRHVERLHDSEKRVFRCIFGGATGTAASFGKFGLKVQHKIAKELNLLSASIPARSHFDHFTEYTNILIMISITFGKISNEIYNLMKNEISEVEEPMTSNDVGSSTMPQKRNPHLTQDVISLSTECKSLSLISFESMSNEHEGSRQHHLMSNNALFRSCKITGEILSLSKYILKNMKIKPEQMRKNLKLSEGSIVSESIMLKLGEKIGRQKSHDIIHKILNASVKNNKNFLQLLKNNSNFKKNVNSKELKMIINPKNYIGLSSKFAKEKSEFAKKLIKKIKKKRFILSN